MQHILEKYSTYRVLEVFFIDPYKNFQLRELARIVKIDHKSVLIHLKRLIELKLVKEDNDTLYKSYIADTNEYFRRMKRSFNLLKIYESGLVDYLFDNLLPRSIVLFGSYSKGTDNIKSDIDIFADCSYSKISLKKYEEKLKRKINVLYRGKMSAELKNNLANGITLKGEFLV